MKTNSPTLADIRNLAKKQASAKETMEHFYDFIEANDDYMMNQLKVSKNDDIRQTVVTVAKNVLQLKGSKVIVDRSVFLEKLEDHFFHGQFITNGYLASYFYFDDLEIGYMSTVDKKNKSHIRHARFCVPTAEQTKKIMRRRRFSRDR